jgi:hypothetical protein
VSEGPVICAACAGLFGGGADPGTRCPFCGGPLRAFPEAQWVLERAVESLRPEEPHGGDR